MSVVVMAELVRLQAEVELLVRQAIWDLLVEVFDSVPDEHVEAMREWYVVLGEV